MSVQARPMRVPGHPDDDGRLWRAVDVFRVASLVYAVALYSLVSSQYRHPVAAWLVLAGLGLWTAFLARHRGRGRRVLIADLVVAVSSVLVTGLLDDPGRISGGAQTLPSIWPASAVLGWAVWAGWRGGLFAAVAVAVADVVEVGGRLSSATVNNIVLLVLTGTVVGYTVELYRAGRRDLARAVSIEAAAAERERLAADIHDSVLQVLAFVKRRGREVGGEAGEIGRLAGEQEVRLRSLITTGGAVGIPDGEQDVRALLGTLAGDRITVTGPAEPVTVPGEVAAAVVAAVGAALDNVARHAGPSAQAWVFVEDEGDAVAVTVRDDGVGIPPGRLEEAAAEGRMGIALSIRSRVESTGGTVGVVSTPGQGTEVEMCLPRTTRRRAG